MYFYKKSDKDKKHPVHLSEAVRFKTLYNKAAKLMQEIKNTSDTLMFNAEDTETKRLLYEANDKIRAFQDSLKVKNCYGVE